MKIGKFAVPVILAALILVLVGCAREGYNKNWQHTAQTLHEGKYNVVVKVDNIRNQPLAGVTAVLVKRMLSHPDFERFPVIPPHEEVVAVTDKSGEFLVQFELLRADDVWIYLDPGAGSGYAPRYVHLNQHMGDSIFNTGGNLSFPLRVVLERAALEQ